MNFVEKSYKIFEETTNLYHQSDDVDAVVTNPYAKGSIDAELFDKNWIDAVQWHLEDIIRDPNIQPEKAIEIKRRIDLSNQDRTDLVEKIDSYFRQEYSNVTPKAGATINTESPAWAIDRLSILALKIYHMKQEAQRTDASADHIAKCQHKLDVLLEQLTDLTTAIAQLLNDIESGDKYMKVYRQMKMYNDPATNPVLYGKK